MVRITKSAKWISLLNSAILIVMAASTVHILLVLAAVVGPIGNHLNVVREIVCDVIFVVMAVDCTCYLSIV